MKKYIWIFLGFLQTAFCSQGIITACCDKYALYLYASIQHLRDNLNCKLPIQIWHAGEELHPTYKKLFLELSEVTIHDLLDVTEEKNPQIFRGWQIKAAILDKTDFDEVILMDADVFFFDDPICLFHTKGYQETGAYFFRDRRLYIFPMEASNFRHPYAEHVGSLHYYASQQAFYQSKVKTPSAYMPEDWRHYWEKAIPTKQMPVSVEKQEAGCVVLNKNLHQSSLEYILRLNLTERQNTYKHVHGDKETYWLACEMAKEPYFVNSEHAQTLYISKASVMDITQFLDGKLFYIQKWPKFIKNQAFFGDIFFRN